MDQIDLDIISFLQTDGRMPFTDIAKALDVSEGTVRNRVARLVQDRMLQIVGMVDPYRLGRLALQSLRNRWVTALLTVLAIAVSVVLLLGVEKVRTGAKASPIGVRRRRKPSTLARRSMSVNSRSGLPLNSSSGSLILLQQVLEQQPMLSYCLGHQYTRGLH